MDYTYLGRIGLQVSRFCLGTVNFGRHATEAESFSVMSRALEAGINFFDTANIYNDGLTETIVGKWLTEDKSRRNQIVLATKLYGSTGEGPNDGPSSV